MEDCFVAESLKSHMGDGMENEDARKQAELEIARLQPIITNSLVIQAVVKAMVETHPDPAALRARAEFLLTEAQGRLALSDAPRARIPSEETLQALDWLFRPPSVVD